MGIVPKLGHEYRKQRMGSRGMQKLNSKGLVSDGRKRWEKEGLHNDSYFLFPANVRVGGIFRTTCSTVFVAQRGARCSLPKSVS